MEPIHKSCFYNWGGRSNGPSATADGHVTMAAEVPLRIASGDERITRTIVLNAGTPEAKREEMGTQTIFKMKFYSSSDIG